MESLRATGMLDFLEQQVARPHDKSTAAWSRVGPIGEFGVKKTNGRISGLQVFQQGGFYWVFAGAVQGGLWRMRSDHFAEWTDVGFSLPNPSVRAFAVDPTNLNRIFVGTGDKGRYPGAGLFRTTDGGDSWTLMPIPFATPDFFYRLEYLGTDIDGNRRLFAASHQGPLYSDDGGDTWNEGTKVGGGNLRQPWTDFVQHPDNPNWLYAAVCDTTEGGDLSGIYVSQSWGESWIKFPVPNFPPATDWGRASLAICRDEPTTMIVMISSPQVLRGVFKSTNGGHNWNDITNELSSAEGSFPFGKSQLFHAQAIAIAPNDPDHFYVGGIELAESTDGGASWDLEPSLPFGHADLTQIQFNSVTGDSSIWFCNDGGIYLHNPDSGTQSIVGNATTGLSVSEIDFMDAMGTTIAIGMQDNGTLVSKDSGATWRFVNDFDGADVSIYDPLEGHIFFNDGVYQPAPNWKTFRKTYTGGPGYTFNPNMDRPSLFYNIRIDRMYTTDFTGLYSLTPDGPLTWNLEYADWRPAPFKVNKMFGSHARENEFWITYVPWRGDMVEDDEDLTFLYKEAGVWANKHYPDFNPTDQPVLTVRPSREWPGEAWVGVASHWGAPKIYHLLDGGETKVDITGTLVSAAEVRTIEVMPFNPETIWAGTNLGVFMTTDGGDTWSPYNQGLPIGRCTQLTFVESPTHGTTHKLLLAIDGRGVWSRDVVMPPVIYVDEDVAVSGDGTRFSPYKTVTEGIVAAPSGAIVAVHTDTYDEPQTVSKNVKIVTWGGQTIIR